MPHDLLAVDIALFDHDLQREDAVTSGRVLVAQRGGGLALLNPSLQDFKNVSHVEDGDLFKIMANNSFLHVFAKLELLLARCVEQVLEFFVVFYFILFY